MAKTTKAPAAEAGIGHNAPPLMPDAARAWLDANRDRNEALLQALTRVPVELDEDSNTRALGFTKQLKAQAISQAIVDNDPVALQQYGKMIDAASERMARNVLVQAEAIAANAA